MNDKTVIARIRAVLKIRPLTPRQLVTFIALDDALVRRVMWLMIDRGQIDLTTDRKIALCNAERSPNGLTPSSLHIATSNQRSFLSGISRSPLARSRQRACRC